jgi:hypothetical protein
MEPVFGFPLSFQLISPRTIVNLSSSGDKCEKEAVKIPLASVAAEKERNDIFHSDVTEASVGPVMTR